MCESEMMRNTETENKFLYLTLTSSLPFLDCLCTAVVMARLTQGDLSQPRIGC